MNLLEWKPEYSVGDPAIDYEHRELIEAINTVYESVRDEADSDLVHDLLGGVYSEVAAHFALEETMMRRHGFEEYEAHKQDHEKLLDEISELDRELARDPKRGCELLSQRLSDWFSIHFSTFDARLHGRFGHS